MINLASLPSPVSTQRIHTHTQYGEAGATEEMKDKKKHRSGWTEKSLKSFHTHTHMQLIALHKEIRWREMTGKSFQVILSAS